MEKKQFEDIIDESHARYTIINHEIFKQGGAQASYNIEIDFFRYLLKNNIIEPDYGLDYPSYDKNNVEFDFWAYTLKDHQLKFGPGALWMIGDEYINQENQFSLIFALNDLDSNPEEIQASDFKVKPQIRKTTCRDIWDDKYNWFVELYEKNISGNKILFIIDENNFTIDILFNSIDASLNMDDIEYSNDNDDYSHNLIFFGAPGTGKSHALNNLKDCLIENNEDYERVSFHPDYSYANFVGTFKPVSNNEYSNDTKDGNLIDYKFVPGPFIRVLVDSMKDKSCNPHLLIIEEINRANVAAIFGDIFQLLDRNNGYSEFPIKASEDLKSYLKEVFKDEYEINFPNDEIKIPDNMYIWATMNSADQGVFMMDTAFKRRWDFYYFGINHDSSKINDVLFLIDEKNMDNKIYWNDLREAINEELLSFNINEDKLIGPFFINPKYLPRETDLSKFKKDKNKFEENGEIFFNHNNKFKELFKNKVLMYLFDDVAKHKRKDLFDNGDKKYLIYSEICNAFDKKGIKIFCKNIQNNYKNNIKKRNDN